jgi:hypothetical protein
MQTPCVEISVARSGEPFNVSVASGSDGFHRSAGSTYGYLGAMGEGCHEDLSRWTAVLNGRAHLNARLAELLREMKIEVWLPQESEQGSMSPRQSLKRT